MLDGQYVHHMLLGSLTLQLQAACAVGQTAKVQELLDYGADPYITPEFSGINSVDVADRLGRLDVLNCLLRNINMAQRGLDELIKAVKRKQPTLVRALLDNGVRTQLQLDKDLHHSILVMACSMSTVDVIEVMLQYGPDLSISSCEGNLAYVAFVYGRLDICEAVRRLAYEEKRELLADMTNHVSVALLSFSFGKWQ